MASKPASLALTPLVEPARIVSPTVSLPGFDPYLALLLGGCCNLTYDQFASGSATLSAAQIAGLGPGNALTQIAGLTSSESIGTGADLGAPGAYTTIPAGFALTGAPAAGAPPVNLIALRGTRTYAEWISDAEGIPTPFRVGDNGGQLYTIADLAAPGLVHSGFHTRYTQGTDGAQPVETTKDLLWASYSRPPGSLAAQVAALVGGSTWDATRPLYVTGHSLGAALAVLCAMDVAVNFPKSFPAGGLALYSLAGPMVAMGVSALGLSFSAQDFPASFQKVVPHAFRIVNAADIVPIVPGPSLGVTDLALTYAHVTANEVAFCAQTGSIGGNHACTDTYVPYLQLLAGGFRGES